LSDERVLKSILDYNPKQEEILMDYGNVGLKGRRK
jgi:hypothetical protein